MTRSQRRNEKLFWTYHPERKEFKEQLKKFIEEGYKLSQIWKRHQNHIIVTKYPKYMPSFDEFLNEFQHLIDHD